MSTATPPPPPLVRPVAGRIARPFAYDRRAPFRRGARRVVRFTAVAGSAVRAPCAGTVRFAGPSPPHGAAVSVVCGRWRASLTGLTVAEVRRGARVSAGAMIGRAGGRPVGLGLRPDADRWGYVDPWPLLGDAPAARRFAPLGPAPRARIPSPSGARAPRSVPRPQPGRRPLRVPAAVPRPAGASGPVAAPADVAVVGAATASTAPLLAWAGLALAAVTVPAARVRGRRRRAAVRSATHRVLQR